MEFIIQRHKLFIDFVSQNFFATIFEQLLRPFQVCQIVGLTPFAVVRGTSFDGSNDYQHVSSIVFNQLNGVPEIDPSVAKGSGLMISKTLCIS